MNVKKNIIEEVLESYNLGLEYLACTYNDMSVIFRMNKDHSRNSRRNDDQNAHNLSLVNRFGNGASEVDSYLEIENLNGIKTIQKQVWGVLDSEDVEKEIIYFLEEIDEVN